MKRKKVPIVIGILCLALIIAAMPFVGACAEAGPTPEKPIEAIISHTYAPGSIWARQVEIMKEHVEKATGGKVTVKIYPAGTMHATYEEGMMACVGGTTQFAFINVTSPQKFDGRWTCYQAPGAVWGWDHWKLVQDTPSYKELNEDLAKIQGIKVFFWSCIIPFGDIPWNTKHPLVTPDDWKGLKMRTAPSPLQIKTVEAFGGTAVPLATPETLPAITEGVVDGGIITPATAMPAWKADETLPYVTMPYGGFALSNMFVGFFVNAAWWDSLPSDIQTAIEAGIPAMREDTNQDAGKGSEELWAAYQAAPGRNVSFLTEEQTKVWDNLIKEQVLPDIIDEFGCDKIFADCEASRP